MIGGRGAAPVAAVIVAAATATIAAAVPSAPASWLVCRLTVPAQVEARSPVPLRFVLVNRGPRAVRVLTWNTPLEGWFGSYLRVKGTNGEVPYRGPQAKRAAPEHGDYVRIRAGKSVSATVDLAQVYALAPGTYQVAFNGSLHDVTDKPPASRRTPAFVDCPAATFEVVP